MRLTPPVLAKAVSATLIAAVVGGCAIIVVPEEGSVRYESAFGGGSGVKGNGESKVERRDVVDASRLDIEGPLQVEVRVGPAPSLLIEADSNLLPLVHADSSDGSLRVWVVGGVGSQNEIRVTYTTPHLSQINSNGSGRLIVTGLNGGALNVQQNGSRATQLVGAVARLDVSVNGSGSVNATALDSGSTSVALNGSGRLELGQVRGDELNVEVRGSGGVRARGEVKSANVRLRGSGGADLAGLRSEKADLSTRGSGGITLGVSKTLVAETYGSGRIKVVGNPAQRTVTGQGVSFVE